MRYLNRLAIFTTFFYLLGYGSGSDLFNHSYSDIFCKYNGGLYNDSNLITDGYVKVDHINSDVNYLNEGESAWVSGYVRYSRFISWHGCYEEYRFFNRSLKYNNDVNKLTVCDKKCEKFPYDYIGIYANVCFCLDDWDLQNKFKVIDFLNCTRQKPYNIHFNSTGSTDKAIHVYRISKKMAFELSNSFKQCTLAKTISNSIIHKTSSCYTQNDKVDGSICINDSSGKLSNTCDNYFDSNKNESFAFCIENIKRSWIGAYEKCNLLSGKLLDNNSFPGKRTTLLKDNYWMGFYRSFEVLNEEETGTCLAVTKNADKLILDPDECSVKKQILCNQSFRPRGANATKSAASKQNNERLLHIGIFVGIGISVAAVIVLIKVMILRKVKKKREHLQITDSVNNDDQDTAPQQNCVNNDIDIPSRICKSKVTPKKPERQTLRKQNMPCSYENFKFKSDVSGSERGAESNGRKQNEHYDRLDLKHIPPKASTVDQIHDDENHVYDHTAPQQNYDTLRSTKSVNPPDCLTYSTIRRQCEREDKKSERFPDNEQFSGVTSKDNKGVSVTTTVEDSKTPTTCPKDVHLLDEAM